MSTDVLDDLPLRGDLSPDALAHRTAALDHARACREALTALQRLVVQQDDREAGTRHILCRGDGLANGSTIDRDALRVAITTGRIRPVDPIAFDAL